MHFSDGEFERSKRFLDAFALIERNLRASVDCAKQESFYSVVDRAASRDPLVRRYQVDLKELADLRNAIVHERIDGEPIAEPHAKTVVLIESIAGQLTHPRRVDELYLKDVASCSPRDRIKDAARKMLHGNFSQLPIYDDARFVGLLTSETVARWVATRLDENAGLLEDESINTVLRYSEDSENHAFLRRNASVVEAIEVFEDFTRRGRSLDAIIITADGKGTSRALGIVTVFDLPTAYAIIDPRRSV